MAQPIKLTSQGVRDLNELGGKRINGKRRLCPHLPEDVFVSDRIERRVNELTYSAEVTYSVNVLTCSACEQILGPEDEIEGRS